MNNAASLGEDYGKTDLGKGKRVLVEFVSANPTGPMHIGNARGGAIGDSLSSLLQEAGYEACIYFNRHLGYYGFDLSQLTDHSFWIALPGTFPDFYYQCELWQYSFNAEVPGIEGPTDMNIMFVPVATPEPSPTAAP